MQTQAPFENMSMLRERCGGRRGAGGRKCEGDEVWKVKEEFVVFFIVHHLDSIFCFESLTWSDIPLDKIIPSTINVKNIWIPKFAHK